MSESEVEVLVEEPEVEEAEAAEEVSAVAVLAAAIAEAERDRAVPIGDPLARRFARAAELGVERLTAAGFIVDDPE